uniref:Uncharacterized protein n=1 Tax=Noctiluca scintillans TaxID=2966 RepID=A0A7S0ZWU4_NOCSC|mmetsp:Transcript_2222/g.6334  ORF Transcript_2222/g.6334 Transcript_2222/m.6334 type:complete len:570 (+) Transcript_2222:26-1735(+)
MARGGMKWIPVSRTEEALETERPVKPKEYRIHEPKGKGKGNRATDESDGRSGKNHKEKREAYRGDNNKSWPSERAVPREGVIEKGSGKKSKGGGKGKEKEIENLLFPMNAARTVQELEADLRIQAERSSREPKQRGPESSSKRPLDGKGVSCEVRKHSGMGCAVVSMESSTSREALMNYIERNSPDRSDGVAPKTDIAGVQCQLRRHKDKNTHKEVLTDVFVAWGHRAEKETPLAVDDIVKAIDRLYSEAMEFQRGLSGAPPAATAMAPGIPGYGQAGVPQVSPLQQLLGITPPVAPAQLMHAQSPGLQLPQVSQMPAQMPPNSQPPAHMPPAHMPQMPPAPLQSQIFSGGYSDYAARAAMYNWLTHQAAQAQVVQAAQAQAQAAQAQAWAQHQAAQVQAATAAHFQQGGYPQVQPPYQPPYQQPPFQQPLYQQPPFQQQQQQQFQPRAPSSAAQPQQPPRSGPPPPPFAQPQLAAPSATAAPVVAQAPIAPPAPVGVAGNDVSPEVTRAPASSPVLDNAVVGALETPSASVPETKATLADVPVRASSRLQIIDPVSGEVVQPAALVRR